RRCATTARSSIGYPSARGMNGTAVCTAFLGSKGGLCVADRVQCDLVCPLPLQRPELRLARKTVLAYERKEWHRIDAARLGKQRHAPTRQIAPQDGDKGAKIPRLVDHV